MAGRRIVGVLLGVVVIPVFIAVAVNAATDTTFPGVLRLIQRYPWWSLTLGLLAMGAYAVWEVRSRPSIRSELSSGELARLRARVLAETRRIWVDDVLAHTLAEVVRLDLSVVTQPWRVTHPVHLLVHNPDGQDETLPAGLPPSEIFIRFGERLLILGAPGAGKTTMLLELARDLLVSAADDPVAPVPVVLNLSSWPDIEKLEFEQWLAGELHRFYDLPEPAARRVIERDMVVLLLDGLDEVPANLLPRCVAALNEFRERRGTTPIAVTCRVADYDEYVQPRLHLAGAVVIRPLTSPEVDAWLVSIGPAMDGLRRALREDEELRELLRTPLTLSIAALTYQGATIPEFTGLDSLFAAYTRKMLRRPRAALAKAVTYAETDARRWLTALARGMSAPARTWFRPICPERFAPPG